METFNNELNNKKIKFTIPPLVPPKLKLLPTTISLSELIPKLDINKGTFIEATKAESLKLDSYFDFDWKAWKSEFPYNFVWNGADVEPPDRYSEFEL